MAARTPSKGRPARIVTSYTIEGLRDFIKDLGVIPANVRKAESIFKNRAATAVYTSAKRLAAQTGPQQMKYAQTLKQVGNGAVSYGGQPGSMGAEFGSIVFGQFPTWRGNKEDAGYFFWPAVRKFRNEDMVNLWAREVWTEIQDLFSGE